MKSDYGSVKAGKGVIGDIAAKYFLSLSKII
jgi:hypothetical protein